MAQPSFIVIELMIEKFSEFLDWIFDRCKKTELDKFVALNSHLKQKLNFTLFDITEIEFDTLRFKLESIDSTVLEEIISLLYKVSISTSNIQTFERLKSNKKLNERIMEIITFIEVKHGNLPLELYNVKNSLQQQLRSESIHSR
ncbi:MAG: hypothetical protein PSV16_08850 [Flavobacterium sp.]|nr:hypothetical protein [Flavobacterium sp.]